MSYSNYNYNPSERIGIYVTDNITSNNNNYVVYTHDVKRGTFIPVKAFFYMHAAGGSTSSSKIQIGSVSPYTNYYALNTIGNNGSTGIIFDIALSVLRNGSGYTPVTGSGQTIVLVTTPQTATFTGSLVLVGFHAER